VIQRAGASCKPMTHANTNLSNPPTIPGYKRIPIVGNRLDLLRFFSDPIGHLLRLQREFGSLATFTADDPSLVLAFGPENTRAILSDPTTFNHYLALPFPIPKGSPASRIFNNILSMNGERHKRHRRMLMPVVNKAAVSSYAPAIVRITNRFLERWNSNKTVNLVSEMSELTIRVSTHCLFGKELASDADSFGQLSLRLLGLLTSPWTIVFPVNMRGTPYARFLETTELIEKVLRQLISERSKEDTTRQDVLSMLMRARDEDDSRLDDDEIIALTTSMLFGGQDALTNTLSWALVLLSQHPDILDDVQSEIDKVLHGADPTEHDIARLPLLDAVVNETMRLLPAIVHLMFRRSTAMTRIGPYELPQDAVVVVSPFVAHRHPDLFPNPQRFDPQRWNHIKPGPYEYMPFGAGPRLCIGAGFSAQVLRLQLATILQRFRPVIPPGVRIDHQVRAANLGAKGPVPLRLASRHEAREKFAPVQGKIRELVDFPASP